MKSGLPRVTSEERTNQIQKIINKKSQFNVCPATFFVSVADLTGELVRHTCIYFLSEKNLKVGQPLVSGHLH